MKRRHLWMVAISLIVAVCMSFCLAACDSCNKDDNKSHKHNYTWTPNEDGTTHNGVCNAEGECDAKNVTNEAHSYGSDDKCKCGAVKPGDGPVEHKHNYVWTDNKDGTHSGVCNSTVGECDAKNITNQPHVYGGDNKCACGAVKPDDNPGHTHNYGDWTVDPDDATKHVRTCDVDGCDKPVEREAHVWGDNDKCEKCGVDKPDEPNPDHTHNYGDWTVDPDDATKHVRTCDVDGCDKPVEREAHVWGDNDKCEKCGVDKPDEPNPDHTHNYGDWTVDPDDSTKHVRTCDVDGCDKPVEREAHVWGDNDKCEKCGVDKPDEPNPEHKHNYTYTDNGDGTHTGTCAVDGCDAPTLEPEEHVWGANNTCACGAKKPNDRPAPAENTVSFVFDRVTGSALYADAEALNAAFEDACNDLNVFGGVTETANVYANTADAGSPALKFGTSKALGSVTLSFERTVAKVVINCKAWSGDSAKLVVNGAAEGTAKDVPATQGDVEFDLGANASNTITIASYGSTSKNRCFIYSITVTFKVAQPLNAPELDKLDEYGVITWKAVDGAAKYAYRIGDGEVNYVELTEDRKVTLADGATIKVWAVGDGFDYIVDNEERALTATYTLEQVTLSMADVTEGETVKEIVKINKSTGKVSWSAVKGAVKYVYTVKDNEGNVVDNQENVETDVPVTTITLGANYSITIKAIGDGTVYLDSAEVTKTRVVEPTTLDAPEVLILRDGTVKIKNTDAVSFSYSIDGGTAVPVDNNHDDDGYVVLTELMKNHSGKAIAVTSIGNGNEISDSETPTSKTYVAPATFTDVEVDFAYTGENKHEVTVSWFAVTGATAYEYAVNGTALQNVEATTETVEGNTKYTITITLAEDDVFTLTVVGDEVANEPVIAGGDYSSKFNTADIECAAFEIDNSKVYSVAEIIEVMNYYGMVANDVTSKDFKVKGVVTEIASTSGKPFAGYYVTDGTNGRAFEFYNPEFDESKVSADIIAIKEQLVHYSVTAEGKLTIYGSTKEFKNSCTIIAVALEEAGASEMAKGVLATAKTALTAPTGTAGTAANTVEYTLVSTVGENNVPVTWDTDNITVAWDEETTDELGANIVSYADGKLIVTLQDHKISVSITANLSYTVAYDGGSKTETDSKTFTLKLNAKGDNSEDPEPEPHSFDLTASFANGYGSSAWGSSYGAHTVYITDTWGLSGKSADSASALGTIKFANANQQSSNITDCPVFKSGENGPVVELYNHTITSVTFTLKQWTTKTYSSIEIKYSTDGINWSTSGNLHTTNASTLGSAGATKDFSYNITDTGVKYVRVVVGGANQIGVSAISLKVLPVA